MNDNSLNPNCPCKRTNCVRHGNCAACKEHHHCWPKIPLTTCERIQKKKEMVEARKPLADALKAHRKECKLTQKLVAETLGVSTQTVSKWENGKSDLSPSDLQELTKLYKVSVDEILKESSNT